MTRAMAVLVINFIEYSLGISCSNKRPQSLDESRRMANDNWTMVRYLSREIEPIIVMNQLIPVPV
jgi:hypothetical protein